MNNPIDEPLVSIIIPTYGRPDNLGRAIQSVINQTYSNWELLVIDDNEPQSKERSETSCVIDNYKSNRKIHYIQHPQNLNGSAARNTGIHSSNGEYISFLDDDDEYMPDRLTKCVEVLKESEPNIAGVYTGCVFYKDGKVYRRKSQTKSGNFLVETLATTFESHSGSNIFVKSSVVKELNGFDESFTRHQDYEFFVRLFEHYDLLGLSEVLLIKHENWSNLPNLKKMEEIKRQYLGKYNYLLEKLPKKSVDYIMYSNYISLAILALEAKSGGFYEKYLSVAKTYNRVHFMDFLRILRLDFQKGIKVAR